MKPVTWFVRLSMVVLGVLVVQGQMAPYSAAQSLPRFISFTAQPDVVLVGVQTQLTLTAVVSGPGISPVAVKVERQEPSGFWKHFANVDLKTTAQPNVLTAKLKIKESAGSILRLRLNAAFLKFSGRAISPEDEVTVGQPAPPNNPRPIIIQGPAGSNLTMEIPANSVGSDILAAVAPAPAEAFPLPPSAPTRVATVDVVLRNQTAVGYPVIKPVILRVPAPSGTPDGTRFYFVQATAADSLQGGLTRALRTVDTGRAVSGFIVSDFAFAEPRVEGITASGTLAVLRQPGSGYVEGTVRDTSGNPRPHVWLCNLIDYPECNGQGFFTNANGQYRVPVVNTASNKESSYRIKAIDGFRCAIGESNTGSFRGDGDQFVSATGTLFNGMSATEPADPSLDIVVNPVVFGLNQPNKPTRDGIRNGGMEVGTLTCWKVVVGTATAVSSSSIYQDLFGFQTTIAPPEGESMMVLKDPVADVPTCGANTQCTRVEQRFILPAAISNGPSTPEPQKLRFEFNFGCPTVPCTTVPAGTPNDAELQADLFKVEGTNLSESLTLVGSVTRSFRQFNGALGWRLGTINLHDAGNVNLVPAGTHMVLRFTARNMEGGAHVLIDRVRFERQVITAHVLEGAMTGGETTEENKLREQVRRVKQQVRFANEILAQGGINLDLRRVDAPVPDPLNLVNLDVQVTSANQQSIPTTEMTTLLILGPQRNPAQDPASDIQVYYTEHFTNAAGVNSNTTFGVAVTNEDFDRNITPGSVPDNLGVMMPNLRKSENSVIDNINREIETLGHELGHRLMPLASAQSTEEHDAQNGNIMTSPFCEAAPTDFNGAMAICSSQPIFGTSRNVTPPNFNQTTNVDVPDPPQGPRCDISCPD